MNDSAITLPESEILSTVPFKFKGIHSCSTIVAMPISFNFSQVLLKSVEDSLGIKSFDLFGIPAFTKRFAGESATVLETLKLSAEKHHIEQVVLFQHVDFHKQGESTRFSSIFEEDYYHKGGLISSMNKIRILYPRINVRSMYARLVNNRTEIEIAEVFGDGSERIRMVAPYLFRDSPYCEAAAIYCLDFRLRRETRVCIRDSLGISSFDMIVIPGSTKRFHEDAMIPWKAIKVAYEQHGCRVFAAVHHADCGAYGGSGNFPDAVAEEMFHRGQINSFEKELKSRYLDATVIKVYARLIEDYSKIQFVRFF